MIDATFVQAIRSLTEEAVAVETIEIDERTYTNREAFLVKPPRLELPETLVVHTLTGLMDYLKENKDGLALKDYTLHVVNPGTVELISAAQGDYHQRYTFAVAQNYDRGEKWSHYRQLPSLRHYVLLSQSEPLAEHYSRESGEQGIWQYVELRGAEAVLDLSALPAQLPLGALYRRLT